MLPTIRRNGDMTTIVLYGVGEYNRILYFSYDTLIGFHTSEGQTVVLESARRSTTRGHIDSIGSNFPIMRLNEKDFKQAYKELF
jgi:hypothetical protein